MALFHGTVHTYSSAQLSWHFSECREDIEIKERKKIAF